MNERLRSALLAIHAMSVTAPDESDRGFAALLGIESIARHALRASGDDCYITDSDCAASPHRHGCYADTGDCDAPSAHVARPPAEIGCKHIMFRGGVTGRVVTCGVCDWCTDHFGLDPVRGSDGSPPGSGSADEASTSGSMPAQGRGYDALAMEFMWRTATDRDRIAEAMGLDDGLPETNPERSIALLRRVREGGLFVALRDALDATSG